MDSSTSADQFMYHNQANADPSLNSLFDDLSDFAHATRDAQNPFDLIDDGSGLATFAQQAQPVQHAQAQYNQAQHQTQSQSPALPQFRPSQNSFSHQYGQNAYTQQPMQNYDPALASRPTPSPGPYDQFAYHPQHMNYNRNPFDYTFNSFDQQRQSAPSQAFHPQVTGQPQAYMNMSRSPSQPQSHISQVQNLNGLAPYSFQPNRPVQQGFVDPSMLGAQAQQNNPQVQHPNQNVQSHYFTKAGTVPTLDPSRLNVQQYSQLQQAQGMNMNMQLQQMQQPRLQPQPNMQTVSQSTPQNMAAGQSVTAHPKVKMDGKPTAGASDSGSDLDVDEEDPEPRPACITIAKPTDERGKLRWELVDSTWSPRNKPAPPEKIRSAVKFVGDTIRGLRDLWKESNDQLKKAENSKQQIEGLKETVQRYRGIMETAVLSINQYGHPSILKRLGENLILLSALYSFLLDRVNADDYESTLVVNILKLATQLQTVDEEQLEKVKWTKILTRFVKKCSNESKTYAQQILANAKKATARKKAENADQGPASPAGSLNGQVAGVKRPREGGDGAQPAKKAPVKQASKPLSVQIAEQRAEARKAKEKEKGVAANGLKPEKPVANSTSASAVAARPKVTAAVPQKANPFAGLMSASKKPGTTNAERAAKEKVEAVRSASAAPAVPKRETVVKPETPVTKPVIPATSASSFLGFLADMEKPKEAQKHKIEEDPSETPDARAKRLRKESRRKLRVSWKPESELVETRIFVHDPEEETGHEDSQTRDVGDTGKEGEMLKKGIHAQDVDDDESDEDDDAMEYHAPSEVDFSTMKQKPEDDFENMNYIKNGGNLKPESPASKAQDEMEYGKEMAIYRPGEQPSTPKEPPEADDDDFDPVVDFGEPHEPRVRQREQQVLARRQAYRQPQQLQSTGFDLASALSSLQPQSTVQSQQPDWLKALGMVSQPSQARTQPPPQLDLATLLAVAQQMQQNPAYQAPVSGPPPASSNSAPAPNVAALLSQLNGFQQPSQQSFGPSLPTGVGDNPNPFPGSIDQSSKSKKDKKRGKGGVPLDANGLPYNYKTKVCQFWLEGKCTKGDACTYRHDREGLDNA